MKVLIASDCYKYQTSGAANVVITLADELRRMGHSVKVLALSNTQHSFKDGDDYYIGSVPGLVYPDVRFSLVRHDPLLKELKEWKPDIIHMHTEFAAARMARTIAEKDGTPFVMTCHTDYAKFLFGRFCNILPVRFFARQIGRFLYRGAKVVTSPSDKALSFPHLSTQRDHMLIIPNGIRLEQYQKKDTPKQRRELFKQLGFKDNSHTIVIVSRLSREKNIHEIIEYFPSVLERLSDAQLLIVGDGPEKENLETYVSKLGVSDSVRFTGRIPPEEVYLYYNLGDVFVSASTFEVHSLTYLEAMAQGLPLICRNDPCLHGVLEDKDNGFAYDTKEEFVDDVVSLLTDEDLHRKMSSRALEKAGDFSAEHCAEQMLELYQKVLNNTL